MKPILLHYSDLHGKLPEIPQKFRNNSDVIFVFSGDVCKNFPNHWVPCIKSVDGKIAPSSWNSFYNFRQIDWVVEGRLQEEWLEAIFIPHLKKNGVELSQIVIISGNHDGADFEKLFPNALNDGAKTIELFDTKVGLVVGVNPICGEWTGEISYLEFENRIKKVDPVVEILITHSAPYGVLDEGYGNQSLYISLFGKSAFDVQPPYFNHLKLHLFGHSHGAKGSKHFNFEGRELRCYNASQTRFEINWPNELVELK